MSSDHNGDSVTSTEPDIRPEHGLLAKLLPELSTLLVLLALFIGWVPERLQVPIDEAMVWLVALEGATLLFMLSLVDIATRLKKPPPWWLGILLVAGLLLLYPDLLGLAYAGLQQGLWVFLPLLWSLLERFRELWTLPLASRVEKLRRRALSMGRVATGLVVAGVFVLTLLAHAILLGDDFDPEALDQRLGLPLLCVFYLIAAYDCWRVHRPAFAERPRSLWPFFDDGATAKLSPL